MSYFEKTGIYSVDSPSIDAFGRWRISEAFTLFDSKFLYQDSVNNMSWAEKTVGNSTSSYRDFESSYLLIVSPISGSRVVRQTRRYMPYQPGKSQVAICTGNLGNPADGIIKRIGYFNDKDGIFFQLSGSSVGIVKRTDITEEVTETYISQSEWNLDKMDGTGPSGFSVDFTKSQVYFFDFEWLDVGRIRYGLYMGGEPQYVHQFTHINETPSVLLSTPNLPIRYEIINNIGSTVTGSMRQICSAVVSEGGYQAFSGRDRSVDNADRTMKLDTTEYAMMIAIRQQPGKFAATLIPTFITSTATNNTDKKWALLVNPILAVEITGSQNWNPVPASNMEFITGSVLNSNAITNEGVKILSGFLSPNVNSVNLSISPSVVLGCDVDGNRDILVFALKNLGNSIDVNASFGYKEII